MTREISRPAFIRGALGAVSAANSTLVIDLRQLPSETTYDDGTGLATIPAATQLDSVQTRLAGHGRSIPSGSCPSVGVAGLTLGGGVGARIAVLRRQSREARRHPAAIRP
jgi:FAD/FMN-containing dehydrogenase